MTQTSRWLAALGLVVAFACTVRAEEEQQEAAPRPSLAAELPPTPALPTQVFPLLFAPPCPCPVPMPMPVGMYGLPSGPICLPCPCPVGCGPAQACACAAPEDAPQYVVAAKMVKAAGDDFDVTVCPRIAVLEGQPATIHIQGYQTVQGRSSLEMLTSVTKEGKGARLALAVTEASANDSDQARPRSHNETTQAQFSVSFGKPYRMELKDNAYMEVTVTEEQREQRVRQAACGCGGACRTAAKAETEENEGGLALNAVVQTVNNVGCVLSDTATGAFGWVFGADEDETEPAPQAYLQSPPQYMPACQPATLTWASANQTAAAPCPTCGTASCPKSGCGCTQCVATETVKKPTVRIRIDAKHSRTCVEVCGGDKCWKASADQVTVTNGRLILEGDVHGESGDGSTDFTADKIVRDLDGLEIQVGD